MKISDLIRRLQFLKRAHGDLPIVFLDTYNEVYYGLTESLVTLQQGLWAQDWDKDEDLFQNETAILIGSEL